MTKNILLEKLKAATEEATGDIIMPVAAQKEIRSRPSRGQLRFIEPGSQTAVQQRKKPRISCTRS